MNPTYDDIRDRIAEPPKWFDENAVPRYCDFHPENCDIYATEAILLRIACQNCGREFDVAMTWSNLDGVRRLPKLSEQECPEYSDPPNVECCASGPTMNSIPLRVVEFWQRESFEWVRRPDLERELDCGWMHE